MSEAVSLIEFFREREERLTLAESCTCGMAAALVGQVPGASEVFCGSAVTYRESAKTDWLGVDAAALRQFTAESREATDAMATGVLAATSEAHWGAAITGHLGPGAPVESDGRVFVSMARRGADGVGRLVAVDECVLQSTDRIDRQKEAAEYLIEWILKVARAAEDRV
ncbi:CinA family protein [Rhodopirellula sallentina]|uniref:CinA domain protein n=1 Tax=Rhodopirellula sallentina SM41 TaxID=1263870 RepID=M5TWJ3_9BACT|nr:nicotinamide-nucleotide amidohydrolase family protein [Rhodopirellula sallentina]EMI53545.1 CinA domain protein [Rhodopirellula sallentina SM41]